MAKWTLRLKVNTFLFPIPRAQTYTLPGRVGISPQRAGHDLASRGQAPSTALAFMEYVREALKNKNTECRPNQQLQNRCSGPSFMFTEPWS